MSSIIQTEPMCLMCEEHRRTANEDLLYPISDRMQELGIDCLFTSYNPRNACYFALVRESSTVVKPSNIIDAAWFDRYGKLRIQCYGTITFHLSMENYGDALGVWIAPSAESQSFSQEREIWRDPRWKRGSIETHSARILSAPIATMTPMGVEFASVYVVTCHKPSIVTGNKERFPGFVLPYPIERTTLGEIDFGIIAGNRPLSFGPSDSFLDQISPQLVEGVFVPYSDDHARAGTVLDYVRTVPDIFGPRYQNARG